MARFEREAQVLASLNHAHIAAIHGVEHVDDKRFLVLELVEGVDLHNVWRAAWGMIEASSVCDATESGFSTLWKGIQRLGYTC